MTVLSVASWQVSVAITPCQPVSKMGACCDDLGRNFHHRGAV